MNVTLTAGQKVLLVALFFSAAFVGFLVKLPQAFRHNDKVLHAAFYFLAAAFLNLLFAGTKLLRHLLIFGSLYLFGVFIEAAQDYSNTFFHKRIHGRFDPEDLQWNLKGLLLFSALWLLCTLVLLVYKRTMVKNGDAASKPF